MDRQTIILLSTTLLVLLWSYTAASKLMDFSEFQRQMNAQAFGKATAALLTYLLPTIELSAALLLLSGRTRLFGNLLSLILMALFTGYIALVVAGFYPERPCSCGGVFRQLGWEAHLYFNIFFLAVASLSTVLQLKREIPFQRTKKFDRHLPPHST